MLELINSILGSCNCGKNHSINIKGIEIGKGKLNTLIDYIKKFDTVKPFIVMDSNTELAAGNWVKAILDTEKIEYSTYVFTEARIKPTEFNIGKLVANFDNSCDLIIGVGSGVINDLCKILSNISKNKYIIIATAPSMDGYASNTSSVELGGLKVSLQSKMPDVIIGDTEILKKAPDELIISGVGDMIAKYVSICEWRISSIITGEYYCESVADVIRKSVKQCVNNVGGLSKHSDASIEAVFEGLVNSGLAMAVSDCTRPASGNEHYFSHIWDMRELEFNTKNTYHGIACGLATQVIVKLYNQMLSINPNKIKAIEYFANFNYDTWKKELKDFIGRGSKAMIEKEKIEHKYSSEKHSERLDNIISNWPKIKQIIKDELPTVDEMNSLISKINFQTSLEDLEIDEEILRKTFYVSKDIRDKYILSRLAFDIGVIEELKF